MSRLFLTILLPLIAPTALYLAWVAGLRRLGRLRRRAVPWIWLGGAGVLVLAIVLVTVDIGFGTGGNGVYMPARWVHGRIVPGRIAPRSGG